jgi:outer membrane protein assembly factor BamA
VTLIRNRRLRDLSIRPGLFFVSHLILSLFLLAVPAVHAQQGSAGRAMRLGKIEFTGLQSRTQEEAIAASGLKIGQMVDVPALDAAAQRLLDSGLFKNLSYRLRTNSDQATVIFKVEEERGAAAPVLFDNFVWFSDEELKTAIRRTVPSYDGTAPDSAVNGITSALQKLLDERKIPGHVAYLPSANLAGGDAKHVFSVADVKIPICTVHYTGAAAVKEDELLKNSSALMKEDYSQSFVLAFAQANLTPLYRERAHLRARFRAPQAKLEASGAGNCKDGVTVTVPVEEGLAYSWDKAEWGGNDALSAAELDAALGMKAGELANGLKIDKGIKSVLDAYGTKGYLTARVEPVPSFEDASKRVTYRLEVKEGPQYRMGQLNITGLSESASNRLRGKWTLLSREVYDDTYLSRFLKTAITGDLFNEGEAPPKGVKTVVKPDKQKLTVDVTINFQQ